MTCATTYSSQVHFYYQLIELIIFAAYLSYTYYKHGNVFRTSIKLKMFTYLAFMVVGMISSTLVKFLAQIPNYNILEICDYLI